MSCHCLSHTLATQLLNADADLSSIQDLLGHTHITTTQRYCRVANLKVQRDYYKAMEVVLQRMQALEEDEPDPRSHAREHSAYGQRVARGHGSRREEGAAPRPLDEKEKEVDEVGERRERGPT